MASTLLLATLGLGACAEPAPEGAPKPFEEVVVDSGDDTGFTTVFDEIGPRPVDGISGLVPPDFPKELPLYTPAGLVDFGAGASSRFLLLQTESSLGPVREEQLARLRRAGWRVTGDGLKWKLDRAGRTVRLTLRTEEEITQLRFDY